MPRYTRGQYEWFFREADADDDGHISLRDLETVLDRFKYPIDAMTLLRIFRETDLNSDDRISFKEYMYAMGQPADGILNDIVSGVIKATPVKDTSPPPKRKDPVVDHSPAKCTVEYELEAQVKDTDKDHHAKPTEVNVNGHHHHRDPEIEVTKVDSPLPYEDDIERQLLELTVDEPVEVMAERPLEAAFVEAPVEALSHHAVEAEPEHHPHHHHHSDDEIMMKVREIVNHQYLLEPPAEYSITEERIDTFWLEPKFFEPQLEGKVTEPRLATVTVTETHNEFMGSILKGMFNKYDKDGSGSISKSELKTLFTELGQKMTEDELDHILAKEGLSDGNIDFNAFVRISMKDHSIEKTSQKTVLVAE